MYVLLCNTQTKVKHVGTWYSAKQEIVRVVKELTKKLSFDKKHSVTVTMNISPSMLATWVVLASSGGWVSVKNDDLEATVVVLSCTLLRFCFFSSVKNQWCFTTYSFQRRRQ